MTQRDSSAALDQRHLMVRLASLRRTQLEKLQESRRLNNESAGVPTKADSDYQQKVVDQDLV